MVEIPTAVQPMTGIEGFKYQASNGKGSVIHTLFIRDFAAMGSSSFNKGTGGPRPWDCQNQSFLLFLIKGSPSYQMLFTGSKSIGPSQSYRIFKS